MFANDLRRKIGLMALCTAGFLAGCGNGRPALVKAVGQVKLNGEPLPDAIVFVAPIETGVSKYGRPSQAVTDAQGNFTFTTYQPGDGLPAGKYKLGVLKRENVGKPLTEESSEDAVANGVKYSWTVPEYYADIDSSGLSIEVDSKGITPAVIELKRDGAPKVTVPGQRSANDP